MEIVQETGPTKPIHTNRSEALVDFLRSGAAFGDSDVDIVETHMSTIFLVDDRAYKLKKSIKLPFADFSTPDARRIACEREIEVNQMYPSGLYLGLTAVTVTADGFALGGHGDIVDWLVVMKRFDRSNEFDKLIKRGALEDRHIDQLADAIANQHLTAPFVSQSGAGQPIDLTAQNVARALTDCARGTSLAEPVALWSRRILTSFKSAYPKLDLRRRHGFVKRCHGDLHLANVCLLGGKAMPFDAIEFSEELATIDVLYDAAFPIMDLIYHGRVDQANRFMNRYLSATQDYCGTELLPPFLSLRAAVRAMTALMASNRTERDRTDDAGAHLHLANDLLANRIGPSLTAIGGLSGTGKSSVARKLATAIAPGAGAIVLRSDVIRKRMAGISPEAALPPSSYTHRNSERVYERLFKNARLALNAGQTVIADAVFLEPEERDQAYELARKKNVPFHGIWLEVRDLTVLKTRISNRVGDASDATESVVRRQADEKTCHERRHGAKR